MSRPTRSETSRAATAHPLIGGNERGRLDVDFSAITGKGMEVTWIRETILGDYDDNNVQYNMERGFTAVEAKDLPGYQTHRLPGARGSRTQEDTLVRRGGLIAMARSVELARQERAAQARETADTLRSVAADTHAAPRDGVNFQSMTPEFEIKTEHRGRFSETE